MRLITAALALIVIVSSLKAEVVLEYDEETKLFSKGVDQKLTGVEKCRVVKEIMA